MLGHGFPFPGGDWSGAVAAASLPAGAYLGAVIAFQRRRRRSWSRWRTTSFLVGCGLLLVGWSPALEAAAGGGLTGHMLQHLVLGMYAPILLALGAPVTALIGASPPARGRAVRRVLGHPLARVPRHLVVATALNVGGMYLLYATPLYGLSTRSGLVHGLVHVHLVVAGYLFAWAVAGPDPAAHRPGLRWRLVALIVAGGAHGLLAKLLYGRAPVWPVGTSYDVADVEAAAQWMYYGGHLADAALITAAFAAWYRRLPRTGAARARREPGRGRPAVLAAPSPSASATGRG